MKEEEVQLEMERKRGKEERKTEGERVVVFGRPFPSSFTQSRPRNHKESYQLTIG